MPITTTFIARPVEVGTHPKLVRDRVGHSDIKLTMDIYSTISGHMALAQTALPALGEGRAVSDTTPGARTDQESAEPPAPSRLATIEPAPWPEDVSHPIPRLGDPPAF